MKSLKKKKLCSPEQTLHYIIPLFQKKIVKYCKYIYTYTHTHTHTYFPFKVQLNNKNNLTVPLARSRGLLGVLDPQFENQCFKSNKINVLLQEFCTKGGMLDYTIQLFESEQMPPFLR